MPKCSNFTELKKVLRTLHGSRGCLWDKRQTHSSLLPYLREESLEFAQTVKSKDYDHMREELGDILLQVMFHSQIASKAGRFDVEDVIDTLVKKLKRRHPHVFGNTKVSSVRDVLVNWDKIKARERAYKLRKNKPKPGSSNAGRKR